MSGADDQERAKELAKLWQGSVVPVEDEDVLEARRERLLPAIGGAIARGAEQRRRALRFRRITRVLAVAAGLTLALGVGRAVSSRHPVELAAQKAESGVVAVAGVVTLTHQSHESVVQRALLSVGDSVMTAVDATADVRLTNLVRARLAGSSEVAVVTPRDSVHRLRLDRGRLDAKVDNRPSTTPKLVVETPNVDIVVTGTTFAVDVTHAEADVPASTRVSVTKGRVAVFRAGTFVAAVTAGQTWSSESLATAVLPDPVPEHADAPATKRAETKASAAVVNTAPAAVAPAQLPSSGSLDDAQLGTLAEENALFQRAVEARRRGDDGSVADTLAKLLSRYPGSPLAAEARVERMRALARAGRREEAAREARRYLAERPDGVARDEARRLVMPDDSSK